MLTLGVFGGKYMTDCRAEFPASWFARADSVHEFHDPALNCFGVNASQPLATWRAEGLDLSTRIPEAGSSGTAATIGGVGVPMTSGRSAAGARRAATRPSSGTRCPGGHWSCRPRQRQALLHWAYDSRIM